MTTRHSAESTPWIIVAVALLALGGIGALYSAMPSPPPKPSSQGRAASVQSVPSKPREPRRGDLLPNISGQSYDGRELALEDFHGNKAIVVHFWAAFFVADAGAQELYNVTRAQRLFGEKGLVTLGYALDVDPGEVRARMEPDGAEAPFPVIVGGASFDSYWAKELGVAQIPRTALLDGNGRVLQWNPRGDELLKAIAEVVDPDVLTRDMATEFAEYERLLTTEGTPEATIQAQYDRLLYTAEVDMERLNLFVWYEIEDGTIAPERAQLLADLMRPGVAFATRSEPVDTFALAAYLAGDLETAIAYQGRCVEMPAREWGSNLNMVRENTSAYDSMYLRHALYLAESGDFDGAQAMLDRIGRFMEYHSYDLKNMWEYKRLYNLMQGR